MEPRRPQSPQRPPPRPGKPRRVVSGVKLGVSDPAFPLSWAAQRWVAYVKARAREADAARGAEGAADPDAFGAGLEYARLGQTRRLSVEAGAVRAVVQGRSFHSYDVSLQFEPYASEAWDAIARAMGEQAKYVAKLLAGEMPPDLEDLFTRLGLHLFPAGAHEVRSVCTCRRPGWVWCKHAVCVAFLLAERLTQDPFLVFLLRGKPASDLIDHLRHRRGVGGAGGDGAAPVHVQSVPGASDAVLPPLEQVGPAAFWDPPADPGALHLPIAPPVVSHPLLRRLGPSPFPQGKFPLVGLLASCYERISEAAVREGRIAGGPDEPAQ